MRTVLSLLPMTRRYSNTAFIRALLPTTSDSIVTTLPGICEVMAASRDLQGVEFRDLDANGRLDAVVQGHVGSGTARAHARQTHRRRATVDRDELDVAAVGLQKRTDAVEDCLNSFSLDGHERVSRFGVEVRKAGGQPLCHCWNSGMLAKSRRTSGDAG